jgi:hypothetical protein
VSSLWYPDEPEVPAEHRGEAETHLRYEDVAQDGRLMLLALPHAIGDVVWRKLLVHHPVARLSRTGVIPILTRFLVEGGGGPVAVGHAIKSTGRFQLAQADGDAGHLMLNMWCAMTAPRGRTYGPPPEHAGEPIAVGRVFAEHVFTRLFAPPRERKVTRFEIEGLPPVPRERYAWRAPEAVLALPPGAEPLDDVLIPDAAPVAFGLNHTDSNQHVNSLVYPRFFIDAALRRFALHGLSTSLLARRLEVAYRKPCFAGQRAKIVLRAFKLGEELGALGYFAPEGAGVDKPFCTLQILFAP